MTRRRKGRGHHGGDHDVHHQRRRRLGRPEIALRSASRHSGFRTVTCFADAAFQYDGHRSGHPNGPFTGATGIMFAAPDDPDSVDLLHLFLQANIVVQVVLIGLLLASGRDLGSTMNRWRVISWERRAAGCVSSSFWSGKSFQQIERTVVSRRRTRRSARSSSLPSRSGGVDGGAELNLPTFRERVQSAMEVEGRRAWLGLERGLLATVGAADRSSACLERCSGS